MKTSATRALTTSIIAFAWASLSVPQAFGDALLSVSDGTTTVAGEWNPSTGVVVSSIGTGFGTFENSAAIFGSFGLFSVSVGASVSTGLATPPILQSGSGDEPGISDATGASGKLIIAFSAQGAPAAGGFAGIPDDSLMLQGLSGLFSPAVLENNASLTSYYSESNKLLNFDGSIPVGFVPIGTIGPFSGCVGELGTACAGGFNGELTTATEIRNPFSLAQVLTLNFGSSPEGNQFTGGMELSTAPIPEPASFMLVASALLLSIGTARWCAAKS
jgi:hypothetical protein